jgi:hypothetical protein
MPSPLTICKSGENSESPLYFETAQFTQKYGTGNFQTGQVTFRSNLSGGLVEIMLSFQH